MLDAIITFAIGLILITGFMAPFIADVNVALLPAWTETLLDFAVGIGILLIIWAFVKAMRSGKLSL